MACLRNPCVCITYEVVRMLFSYLDQANDIFSVHTFYQDKEDIGWGFFTTQLITVILPSLIMLFWYLYVTWTDTKMRRFMAVICLGLFYPIVMPAAIFLNRLPKKRWGEKLDEKTELNIKRSRYVEVIFSNLMSVSIFKNIYITVRSKLCCGPFTGCDIWCLDRLPWRASLGLGKKHINILPCHRHIC